MVCELPCPGRDACHPGKVTLSQSNLSTPRRQDAIAAPPETLLYLPAVVADDSGRPDYLVTVDVDPTSADYQEVHPSQPGLPTLFT